MTTAEKKKLLYGLIIDAMFDMNRLASVDPGFMVPGQFAELIGRHGPIEMSGTPTNSMNQPPDLLVRFAGNHFKIAIRHYSGEWPEDIK